MEILPKIISILKKPMHYLFVGIVLIFWAILIEKNISGVYMLIGLIFIAIAFASFIDWCYKNILNLINQIKFKDKIKKIYNETQNKERMILDYCIDNNILTYTTDPFNEDIINAIQSLSFKGIGLATDSSCGFVLYENILNILNDYIKEKNNAK